jgi:hypothetical protein
VRRAVSAAEAMIQIREHRELAAQLFKRFEIFRQRGSQARFRGKEGVVNHPEGIRHTHQVLHLSRHTLPSRQALQKRQGQARSDTAQKVAAIDERVLRRWVSHDDSAVGTLPESPGRFA